MSNNTQQLNAEKRRQKFSELLREMFQLNQPELDFGLYRIMHARKDDINRFIERDLPNITKDAFKSFATQDRSHIEQELEKAVQGARALEIDPDSLQKVRDLKEKLSDNFDLAREEGEVYDALVTFFNRYYDEGDFLSRRVYKDGTYAIPYQGEEVVLHWANKDQYYIKSSETLRDYTFRLNPNASIGEDPLRVHFKLVDAEAGAKDNNKEGDDNKRVFVLDTENPFELIDSESGDKDSQGNIFKELQLRFQFRAATDSDWSEDVKTKATASAQKKAPTQDHLRAIAVNYLLSAKSGVPVEWQIALKQPYRKADGELAEYSILQGQLNNYTKKNSFDYFIHKDLGGFLSRELDFYIKNELLDWTDIASLKNDTTRLAPLLSKIEVIRSLGEKIIAFLAQLENFQKKLWLKKKFVTEANYCITLDRLAEHYELLEQVFENENQLVDWQSLYALDQKELIKNYQELSLSDFLALPKYRYLMLDTAHFDVDFKAKLIAAIDDLDEQCDGLLVHSENFQALSMLQERYRNEVEIIYADPPYNTSASEISYKNNYKHASWLSLIENRLQLGKNLLKRESGIQCTTIDDVEHKVLSQLLESVYGEVAGTVSIRIKPSGRPIPNGFALSHEYAIFTRSNDSIAIERLKHSEEQAARYKENDVKGPYFWEMFRKAGSNSNRWNRPTMYYPFFVDEQKNVRLPLADFNSATEEYDLKEYPKSNERIVFPSKDDGSDGCWYFGYERAKTVSDEFKAEFTDDGKVKIYYRRRPNEGVQPTSLWFDSKYSATEHGTALLKSIFGKQETFSYPKSIYAVEDCLMVAGAKEKRCTVLDYFTGSGTTGHAVINLNRNDAGQRKYVLIEMGGYFNTVLKPRIQKVVYSENWKSGEPVLVDEGSYNGVSHCFKYIRLESYEDALGNLALNRQKGQQTLLTSDESSSLNGARQNYVMNYMLEVETRGSQSLLNTQHFLDPTSYELKVRSASGDETKSVYVDLLETFNYLLGLRVEHIAAPIYFDAELSQGEFGRWQAKVKQKTEGDWWFRTVYGTNANGQNVLVVWRNLPSVIAGHEHGMQWDNAVLDAVLIEKLAIRLTESQDDEIDILYVNGDHNIAIPRDRKGEPMEQARLQLIEEAFHRLMFAGTDSLQ